MISVAIVNGRRDIRDGIKALLETTDGFLWFNSYPTAEEALDGIRMNPPEVALIDVDLPSCSGIELAANLSRLMPKVNIVMYTEITNEEYIFQSFQAGAIGYLLESTFPTELLRSITEAAAGGAPMSPLVARKVVQAFNRPQEIAAQLSEREYEVLSHLCGGHSYKKIGELLFVSPNTVRFHLKNIYRKLKVKSRYEAVAKAANVGLYN